MDGMKLSESLEEKITGRTAAETMLMMQMEM